MLRTKERRRWQRRSLDATILYRIAEDRGAFRVGRLRDISDGGVSFDTDDPPPEGVLLDMFFKEHANDSDRHIKGRVVWLRNGPALSSVGISFEQ